MIVNIKLYENNPMKCFIICLSALLILVPELRSNTTRHSLDHTIFISQIQECQDNSFHDILILYDEFISRNPLDITARIEKCKFIQNALYDYYEEYNPYQELFDSCANSLLQDFPDNPDVLVFHAEYKWDEELESVLEMAQKSMDSKPSIWSPAKAAVIFFERAKSYYEESNFRAALSDVSYAIELDPKYENTIEYIQILIESERTEQAKSLLLDKSNDDIFILHKKAMYLDELEEYSDALDMYLYMNSIDSNYYNFNEEIANLYTLLGDYENARVYLKADIEDYWDAQSAKYRLLKHDIKYQNADSAFISYNDFRDFGFNADPIGIIRLNLFFNHPLLPWKWRDIPGLLLSLAIMLILIILPFIWILPIYTIGHKWKIIERYRDEELIWGLKSFWFVSAVFLVASFIMLIFIPDYIYSLINTSEYSESIDQSDSSLALMVFFSIMAILGIAMLYKIPLKVLSSNKWKIGNAIGIAIAAFWGYKIITGLYIKIGASIFDVSIEEIATFTNIILVSKSDIMAFSAHYGAPLTYLFVAILIPIYEEIIFRGVILESSKRYVNFQWANVIQAAFFGLVHESLFLFPVFFVFAILTGLINRKAGGLLPGIVFHIANNLLALTIYYLTS